MLKLTPSQGAALPAGVFVKGQAVGDFEVRSVTTKIGPMQFCEGQVLAGHTFVRVSEKIDAKNGTVFVPSHGEELICEVVPEFKDAKGQPTNGVIRASVRFVRPTLPEVAKK